MNNSVPVVAIGSDPVVAFAAAELARYLGKISGSQIHVSKASAPQGGEPEGLWVGVFDGFGPHQRPACDLADSKWDDAIFIETSGPNGIVAGSNPRSVLIAVYRYLTELGCRWVRPGEDGEYLPQADLPESRVAVSETASYRHRGICIEGAVSYQHVRDIIDWSPKVGLNTYFTQFRESYTFFARWYTHQGNPLLKGEPFSVERARQIKSDVACDIKQRGMVFHDAGHGWTCEPFGIPGLGWDDYKEPIPPEVQQSLAEVNGERKLWHNVPLNTNLCYSNPEVREIIVKDIVQYACEHPEVDVIHFWLADGANNQCECESCRAKLPSDFYVMMLNELDDALTRAGLPVRIVFLIYVDLLWPPETERVNNPDRFILMFAPITRTYSREFSPAAGLPAVPPFARNRLDFPKSVEGNLAFLKAWQELFSGDSFDFDYHYMWDHLKDPGYFSIAETLHKDMANLDGIGLNGMVSCQVQRAFFPTGLGMTAMAKALWNRKSGFGGVVGDYFTSAFGPDALAARDYLQELSQLFDPPYIRGETEKVNPEAAASFAHIPAVISAFRPVIARNVDVPNHCHARSWHYLGEHADLCVILAEALKSRAEDRREEAKSKWEQAAQMARERESDLHTVFDVFEFSGVLGGLFRE